MGSLLFYLISFLLSVLFVYLGNRTGAYRFRLALGLRGVTINPSIVIGALIPILISGFRVGVGTDYQNYVTEYASAIQGGSYLEVSFNIIANLSNIVTGSPTLMFIIFGALTVVPVMLALHKTSLIEKRYRWLYWMLFLFMMFPQTFNLLRQGAAVAVGFYLVISIIENKRLLSFSNLLLLLLSVSLHLSAFILIPISIAAYALNNTRQRALIVSVIIFSVLALICISALPQLLLWLGGSWAGYLEASLVNRSIIPRSILIIFLLIICWKYYHLLKISNSYTSLLWLGLIFTVGGLFVSYFERAGYYVTLLLPPLILVAVAQRISVQQIRLAIFAIMLFALSYFTSVYYLMGSSGIFPYTWGI